MNAEGFCLYAFNDAKKPLTSLATCFNTCCAVCFDKDYFKRMGCVLTEMNTQPDHIHILFEAPPQINLANFVNAFKAASSRMVRSNFPEEVSRFYWKPYFWSLSYFIATVSDRSADAVKKYIQNQGAEE